MRVRSLSRLRMVSTGRRTLVNPLRRLTSIDRVEVHRLPLDPVPPPASSSPYQASELYNGTCEGFRRLIRLKWEPL